MTNRLETHFARLVRDCCPDKFFLKLQVHPMAHQKMPADFLLVKDRAVHLFECKECNGDRLVLDRLTQLNTLNHLYKTHDGISIHPWFVICFWKGWKRTSDYYLIDSIHMVAFIREWPKKSINHKEMKKYFVRQSWAELAQHIRILA